MNYKKYFYLIFAIIALLFLSSLFLNILIMLPIGIIIGLAYYHIFLSINKSKKTIKSIKKNENINSIEQKKYFNEDINKMTQQIKTSFSNNFDNDFLEDCSKNAASQLIRANDKFDSFIDLLNNKLDPSEITYNKFFNIVENVYFKTLEHLEKISFKLKALENIDISFINKRLTDIKKMTSLNKETVKELEALRERKLTAEVEKKGINNLISLNENILNEIDNIRIKIANLETTGEREELDLEFSISELRKLSKQIELYNN